MRRYTPMALILCELLLRPAAFAQSVKGSIAGDLLDGAGKPVSGATITLTSEETFRKRKAVSDSRGEFVISALAPGWYRLEAERDGFRKHVQRLELGVNQEMTVDIPLIGGRQEEEVVVTALRGTVKTDSAALGGDRQPPDSRAAARRPQFQRVDVARSRRGSRRRGSAGPVRGDFAININGAREDSNDLLLDGVYNGDPKLNSTGVTRPWTRCANSKSSPAPTTLRSDATAAGKSAWCCDPAATSCMARRTNSSATPCSTRAITSRPANSRAAIPAQPVRRLARRTDPKKHFLLRRLSRHAR